MHVVISSLEASEAYQLLKVANDGVFLETSVKQEGDWFKFVTVDGYVRRDLPSYVDRVPDPHFPAPNNVIGGYILEANPQTGSSHIGSFRLQLFVRQDASHDFLIVEFVESGTVSTRYCPFLYGNIIGLLVSAIDSVVVEVRNLDLNVLRQWNKARYEASLWRDKGNGSLFALICDTSMTVKKAQPYFQKMFGEAMSVVSQLRQILKDYHMGYPREYKRLAIEMLTPVFTTLELGMFFYYIDLWGKDAILPLKLPEDFD